MSKKIQEKNEKSESTGNTNSEKSDLQYYNRKKF